MDNPYVKLEPRVNPYLATEMGNIFSAQYEYFKIRNAAMTWANINGVPAIESGIPFSSLDSNQAVAKAREAVHNSYTQASDEVVNFLLANPAMGGELVAEKSLVDAATAKAIDSTDDEALFVEETAHPDVSQETKDNIVAKDRIMATALNELNGISWVDKAINFGEFMLPFFGSTSVDSKDFYNTLAPHLGLPANGGTLSTKEDMMRLKFRYNQLSPEKKAAMGQLIYESALDAADNNEAMAAMLLENFTSGMNETSNENFDKIVAGLDLATFGAGLAGRLARIGKGANAINRAAELGHYDDASELVALSVVSDDMAKTLGVSRVEAAYAAQPLHMDGIMPYMPAGLAPRSSITMQLMEEARQERVLAKTLDEKQILDERLADFGHRVEIKSSKFIPRKDEMTPSRMEVRFSKDGGEDQFVSMDVLGVDELGNYKTAPSSWFEKATFWAKDLLTSPLTKYVDDAGRLVNLPTNARHLQARIGHLFTKAFNQHNKTIKALDKNGQKMYHDLIKTGALDQVEYTVAQLKEMKIPKDVMNAYLEQRDMNRYIWYIKATDRLESYKLQGYDTRVNLMGRINGIGQVSENPMSALVQSKVREVYSTIDDAPVLVANLTADDFKTAKLVKLAHNVDVPGNHGAYRYILTTEDRLNHLTPHDVLQRIPGYVTKIHPNANYFVTIPVKGKVNGVDGTKYTITDQAFSTRAKAEEYVIQKYGSVEKAEKVDGVVIRADRDYDALAEASETRPQSGLYTGKRKRDELLVDGKVDDYAVDHQQAMGRYFENLATQGLYEPVKAELQRTWLNTYKDMIPEVDQKSFKNAIATLSSKDPVRGAVARSQHEYISFLSNFKTEREIRAHKYMRQLAESNEALNLKFANWNKKNGTVHGAVKEFVFHVNLGLLNPSQFLVQGSGAFISFGAHPVAFTKMSPSIMKMIIAETSEHIPLPNTNVARLWKKSGLSEGVTMQADIMEALGRKSKIGDMSSYFFTLGEKTNRIAAFNTAYEVIRSRKGVKALTEMDIPEITSLANNLTLNFSAVNKAKWQNGWMGVITQFQQVWEKSFNQIYNPFIKSALTPQERMGAATTQAMMFGMIGLPYAFGYKYVEEMLTNMNAPEEVHAAVRRGLEGALPVSNSFSSRMAVGSVISNYWIDVLTGNISIQEGILNNMRRGIFGVAGASAARMYQSFNDFIFASEAGDAETMYRVFQKGMLDNFSTGRNLYAAMHTYDKYHQIRSSTGKLQWEGDLTLLEQTLLGLGFTLKEVEDAYYLQDVMRGQDKFLNELADKLIRVYGPEPTKYDIDRIGEYDPELGSLGGLIASLEPYERNRVLELVRKKLKQDKSIVERIGEQFQGMHRPLIYNPLEDN